ncbi:glutathione S-transferase [Herminiimonas sp. KBW02]|uniref:glutathione S-transferase N-terminal domain-containing protein n=1 Tax=Herminiimonas sp. KBW02 TaxID=2153363 RepID=UPI000F59CCEA|nr:glutathione S-transferase N-terminal domain-containing protein [Herminiimonas sp. KBW02]RQO36358.1 glutathione S-transferase [Herminiimonas sp. KBW02]
MELLLNRTSPYARIARIVALEKGCADKLLLIWSDPWNEDAKLVQHNPVRRIPVLVTDDGLSISESLLIALYLDRVGSGDILLPADRYAEILQLTGWAQGLIDAAFTTMITRKHHGKEIDDSVLGQRRLQAIERTLPALDTAYAASLPASSSLTLADIVVAVALDYIAFRLPEVEWQGKYPALAALRTRMLQRESFSGTVFS